MPKKSLPIFLLTFLLLLVQLPANAQSTGNVSIQRVWIEPGLGLAITLTSAALNPQNCQSPVTLIVLSSNSNYKDILSVVLLAKATGVQINAWVTGCTTYWGQTMPTVFALGTST